MQAGVGELPSESVQSVLAIEPWQCAAENELSALRGVVTSAPESKPLRSMAESHIHATTDRRRIAELNNLSWLGIAVITPRYFTFIAALLRSAVYDHGASLRFSPAERTRVY